MKLDKNSMEQILKLTSDQWLKQPEYKDIKILDPDGWDRQNYQFSFFEELIDKTEFRKRVMFSTVSKGILS